MFCSFTLENWTLFKDYDQDTLLNSTKHFRDDKATRILTKLNKKDLGDVMFINLRLKKKFEN